MFKSDYHISWERVWVEGVGVNLSYFLLTYTLHSDQETLNFRLWIYDDVIKWKHFSRYWPFVWGIHRLLVNSPHKGQWRGALMFSLICTWTNSWVKKSRRRWFETTWRWLWRHYNEIRNEKDYSLSSKSIYTVAFATCLTTFFSMVQIGQIVQLLTHWGRYKMAAISQTILSNSFSWMKMLEFRLKFHRNLFHRVQFTIFQHCLKQWWLDYRRIYASLGLNELTYIRYPYL